MARADQLREIPGLQEQGWAAVSDTLEPDGTLMHWKLPPGYERIAYGHTPAGPFVLPVEQLIYDPTRVDVKTYFYTARNDIQIKPVVQSLESRGYEIRTGAMRSYGGKFDRMLVAHKVVSPSK